MNATQLASLIRAKTRTTSDTFSDADMLVYVNTFKDEIAGRIQQERQDIWNMPATFDLEDDKREYAFPDDVLNSMVSLELKFASDGDYVRARAIQAPSDFALSEAQIAGYRPGISCAAGPCTSSQAPLRRSPAAAGWSTTPFPQAWLT
jgi:hypothetical protein